MRAFLYLLTATTTRGLRGKAPSALIEAEMHAMSARWRCGLALVPILLLIPGCSCFNGKPGVFIPEEVGLQTDGEFKVLVHTNLVFRDAKGNEWTAPVGTLSDGASVPRLLLPITDGRWQPEFEKAAIVHDAYCQEENEERLLATEARLLDREFGKTPDDLMLRGFRGNWHRNRAVLHLRKNDAGRSRTELDASELDFKAVLAREKEDPGALNGLTTIAILRDDEAGARAYNCRVLEIAPRSEAAKRNAVRIERPPGPRPP